MEVVQMEEINTNIIIKKRGRKKPNSIVAFMIHGGTWKNDQHSIVLYYMAIDWLTWTQFIWDSHQLATVSRFVHLVQHFWEKVEYTPGGLWSASSIFWEVHETFRYFSC